MVLFFGPFFPLPLPRNFSVDALGSWAIFDFQNIRILNTFRLNFYLKMHFTWLQKVC